MNPLDKRIGELMVRLRLTRRAATQRARLETPAPTKTTPDTDPRRSNYRLVA
ncbi:hypothetical protein [Micromonospora aurantiaca]|uniref:hypothetical protein n=1 Tax=Micromonospora aurantiaca (nom. illeg.) TaxID=47850 RepID=UPI002E19CCDB